MTIIEKCDPVVYAQGVVVFVTHSISPYAIEKWVKKLAGISQQPVDWHYVGGRAVIKALGDLHRVRSAVRELMPEHDAAFAEALGETPQAHEYPRPAWWTPASPPTIYILRGMPGSGKSKRAAALAAEAKGFVVSADNFFIQDGKYNFDPSRIGDAHGECFRLAVAHVLRDSAPSALIVDNTNTNNIEVAPYVLLAQAYGWKHQVVALLAQGDIQAVECAERNTHGVPVGTCVMMNRRLREELAAAPPWWSTTMEKPWSGLGRGGVE